MRYVWLALAFVGTLAVGDNPNLEVAEVMEFANNYYAEVREKDSGIGAMELLIDRPGSRAYPEPGPNMMWNTKYGILPLARLARNASGGAPEVLRLLHHRHREEP